MKMETNYSRIYLFFLRVWLLFQLLLANGLAVEGVKNFNEVMEKLDEAVGLNGRMTDLEAKNYKQDRKIEKLQKLLEEEKGFSKQLSDRISKLESSTKPSSPESDNLLGRRRKRPFRLLPPHTTVEKDKGNTQFLGPATSCHELSQLGYTLNGYYLVKKKLDSNNKKGKIGAVYCQFQQPHAGQKQILETSLGFVDVKSFPVHFYVQRNSSWSTPNSPITFQVERLNILAAMNLTSGIFTTPNEGIYSFVFMAKANGGGSNAAGIDFTGIGSVNLNLNGVKIGVASSSIQHATNGYLTISLQATLKLVVGDKVHLTLGGFNKLVYDDVTFNTHFSGSLLEENLNL